MPHAGGFDPPDLAQVPRTGPAQRFPNGGLYGSYPQNRPGRALVQSP
jgi:hypothetical protein